MKTIKILFFGSTTDSVLVLEALSTLKPHAQALTIAAVITQPPSRIGRKQVFTPTPVEVWANDHKITVLSFPTDPANPVRYENEQTVIDTLSPFGADLLVSASYGQKIPFTTIRDAKYGGLNVHPSLLPHWRGADPVPWSLLSGDHQTGTTIVTLSEKFDEGKIIAQQKIAIKDTDETDALRATLFANGARLLTHVVPDFLDGSVKGAPQDAAVASYARRLTRNDGYIPWEILEKAFIGQDVPVDARPKMLSLNISHISITITNALRALSPWPGVWTNVTTRTGDEKRLKILAAHAEPVTNKLIPDSVQLEGKKPVPFAQFAGAYLPKTS